METGTRTLVLERFKRFNKICPSQHSLNRQLRGNRMKCGLCDCEMSSYDSGFDTWNINAVGYWHCGNCETEYDCIKLPNGKYEITTHRSKHKSLWKPIPEGCLLVSEMLTKEIQWTQNLINGHVVIHPYPKVVSESTTVKRYTTESICVWDVATQRQSKPHGTL
jgi:hypothetical protein